MRAEALTGMFGKSEGRLVVGSRRMDGDESGGETGVFILDEHVTTIPVRYLNPLLGPLQTIFEPGISQSDRGKGLKKNEETRRCLFSHLPPPSLLVAPAARSFSSAQAQVRHFPCRTEKNANEEEKKQVFKKGSPVQCVGASALEFVPPGHRLSPPNAIGPHDEGKMMSRIAFFSFPGQQKRSRDEQPACFF
jgi:hypothetical protein